MKWVLIFYIFNGQGGLVVQQEFPVASSCQDAKSVMMATVPVGMTAKGYCFPL